MPEATFEDLSPALYRRFTERPFEERDAYPAATPQTYLRRLHLLAADVDGVLRPTVGAVLLCADRPDRWLHSAYIQAVAYRGTVQDSAEQIDAHDLFGPLDLQMRDALAFVLKHQRVAAVKTPAREDRPQFSKRALFEAIVNAVVHRDYSLPSARIRLFLFADRLEIRSPGTVPNSMTLESMTELSLPRNEVIANLMARFYAIDDRELVRRTIMDKRGDGVRVILTESERLSGRRPTYEPIADLEVKLTLYAAAPPEPGQTA